MTIIYPGSTIGIIGGGQLGRMMALTAKASGYKIAVLEPSKDSPTGQVADVEIVAPYDDEAALRRLADVSDVITYEFENINYEGLKQLMTWAHVPQGAELVKITQNRMNEKREIKASGAPVANYIEANSYEELKDSIHQIGYPAIVKTAFGGYDGKGQVRVDSEEQLEEARSLFEHSVCIAEAFVPFVKEISVIIQRNANGDTETLPIAENIHVNHILHESIVPARITPQLADEAIAAAHQIAEHLQLVGTLAVEMFVLENDSIVINELAPRPHNSGHYSIEACNVSQFTQHIRAICGLPLVEPKLWGPSVMINLLGQHIVPVLEQLDQHPEWSVHLYGKEEAKRDRKMGHITVMTEDLEKTLQQIEQTKIW